MKPVKVTVVKAIKIDAGPYLTKSYRSAHAAAKDYAGNKAGVFHITYFFPSPPNA